MTGLAVFQTASLAFIFAFPYIIYFGNPARCPDFNKLPQLLDFEPSYHSIINTTPALSAKSPHLPSFPSLNLLVPCKFLASICRHEIVQDTFVTPSHGPLHSSHNSHSSHSSPRAGHMVPTCRSLRRRIVVCHPRIRQRRRSTSPLPRTCRSGRGYSIACTPFLLLFQRLSASSRLLPKDNPFAKMASATCLVSTVKTSVGLMAAL
jgi:hypothetical protein